MRRTLLLVVVALLVVPPALADDELEGYLEEAAAAEFYGTGIVVGAWGDDTAAATYEVSRAGGMSMVHGPGGDLMISGAISSMRSGAEWYGLRVDEWSAWELDERYTAAEPAPVTRLGRPASLIVIYEDGSERARMIVDAETGVPLLTEVLDGDGNVFRMAAMVEFAPGRGPDHPGSDEMPEAGTVMMTADPGDLPATVRGYRRADSYAAPEDGVQVFYTDGLFSFSVFVTPSRSTPDGFDDSTVFDVGGGLYRRIVAPSNVWVHWKAPDEGYLLVGDLPPDHVLDVLAELPAPGERNAFVRLWRRLFG